MKKFEIAESQMQQIANALGECPAKHVFSAIDILRNLKEFLKR